MLGRPKRNVYVDDLPKSIDYSHITGKAKN